MVTRRKTQAISLGFAGWAPHSDIDPENMEKLRRKRGRTIHVAVRKVEEIRTLKPLVQKTSRRVDILVTNAGTNVPKSSLKVTEAEWDYLVDLNLKGVFFTCQTIGALMIKQRRGKIINLASTMGFVALPERASTATRLCK
jgi:NADP-dependent 3-hydroxy acid dehydrogenase YdfG